ncbi:ATP-grasp domain-containing protein [Archangium violaceum]|uniref:ATP-grasp domain-containing protein n=1 Tax=Archangium violaceum TaxID=83451 RepID=UPI002B2C6C06|nr:ATP-grasp domain-containing protein [Archangium gephyra]
MMEPGGAPVREAERPRVLVLCPSRWDKVALGERFDRRYTLLYDGEELVESPTLWAGLRFDVFRWVDQMADTWGGEGLAGVVGTGDYPGCMLASLVGERLGLPVSPARTVVRFSHKYYSRLIQRQLVPEATPDFAPFNPFARVPKDWRYPRFIKPVKGTMSIRAQLVHDPRELRQAVRFSLVERVRKHLLLRPFQHLLCRYTDGEVPAWHFIGEEPLEGVQVTVDGFVEGGRGVVMGIVDSVMYPGTISFQRFEMPSHLPSGVQERMRRVAVKLMEGSGFNHACFNIEMFYDAGRDRVSVIEVNPRMSYQFSDLYERVSGMNTYEAQLALAVGQPVPWKEGGGRDGAAASFVLRRFSDARVERVPSAEELERVQQHFPGTVVQVLCAPGERLSHHDQDVGSYRYGIINMGAPNQEELFARYAEVERMLPFGFI